MITKSLFVKGRTDDRGRLTFRVDKEFADLSNGIWHVKAEQIIIQLQINISAPISCSIDFCSPPLNGSGERQPVRLALCVITGKKDDFVSLTSKSAEFISFQYPSSQLDLILSNEWPLVTPAANAIYVLSDTPVIAHFIIAKDIKF